METPCVGSKWDDMLSKFDEKCKSEKICTQFEHETRTQTEIFRNKELKEIMSIWLDSLEHRTDRTTTNAKLFREKGNNSIKQRSTLALSIQEYTMAIYLAPQGSVELALAHANRAMSLIEFKYFQEAYWDCEMALKNNYPENKVVKVYFRQATCAMHLMDVQKLDYNINKIIEDFNIHKPDEKNKENLNFLFQRLQKLKKKEDSPVKPAKDTEELAEKFEIKSNPKVGRYVTAKTNIKENELIAKDKAFAFVPIYEYHGNEKDHMNIDCQTCGITNIIPFPCSTCGEASYCSPKCVSEHIHIHKFECSGYKKNLWYFIGIAHLALRTLLCGFSQTLNISTKSTNIKKIFDDFVNGDNADNGYQNVLKLLTNFDKMDFNDTLQYGMTAAMLARYLKKYTNFYDNIYSIFLGLSNDDDYEEMSEIFVASLIMRHMGQLICNGHALTSIRIEYGSLPDIFWIGNKSLAIGCLTLITHSTRLFTGIYPLISMLNHSCEPNIYNKFEGSTLYIMGRNEIKPNEEIYNCYGMHYKLRVTELRKNALKEQYYFDCKCKPCNESNSKDVANVFYCPNDNCKHPYFFDQGDINCIKCGRTFKLNVAAQMDNAIEGNTDNLHVLEMYDEMMKYVGKYNDIRASMAVKLYRMNYQHIEKNLKWNKHMADIAYDGIAVSEFCYGVLSLEYAMSYMVLLDVLALRKRIQGTYFDAVRGELNFSCFDILATNIKCVIHNYIKMYLE